MKWSYGPHSSKICAACFHKHVHYSIGMQGTEDDLPLQTVCSYHSLLYIKFLIIEGATIVHLTQIELVKAQKDMAVLLELCTAHPRLLGKPMQSSLYMLTGHTPVLQSLRHALMYSPCGLWFGTLKSGEGCRTICLSQSSFVLLTWGMLGTCMHCPASHAEQGPSWQGSCRAACVG